MSSGTPLLGPHRFTTYPQWIGTVTVRAQELADSLGVRLATWDEDGLGLAQGFLWRLASGRVILARELEHELADRGEPALNLHVDLSDVAEVGAAPILGEALAAFELATDVVTATPPPEVQEYAREHLRRLHELRQ